MQGKVKITAVLTNPDGVYESEFKYAYEDGKEPNREAIAMQGFLQFREAGMTRKIDEFTYEVIPWHRVVHVQFEFSAINTLGIATASFSLPKDAKLR